MKIGYLGAGTWGFALATVLANNGHEVIVWTRNKEFADLLQKGRKHPKLSDFEAPASLQFTSDLKKATQNVDVIVESVTSSGIRPVFTQVGPIDVPIIVTSKGIEQKTGLLLPEVISAVLGQEESPLVGVLSGPSHAEDIVMNMPTSVVCSAYEPGVMKLIQDLFTTPTFRIYPNADVRGVCFGGAMKNIIAIACGIADGLGCGDNTKAALMTRGLHEIRKLCVVKECKPETLNGLSGMGDLCVTCMSVHSRNYRFGRLVSEGLSPEGAKQKIGMAVEGIYTCVSARELGHKNHVPVPITEATYQIIYGGLDPREAVKILLQRAIKEEHL
ncbi:MAG: glycerol-3-phosphate dehydrogenase [Chlamydiae bacterium CG10_big_fil_rev_8_21_14_0_10_42_34]|nr:MAG: glycerol-3-phosphate dehydrogenase [Chlamydiae bacterium CG10_big_fil_rev_8_21_14_0_10_42_34]